MPPGAVRSANFEAMVGARGTRARAEPRAVPDASYFVSMKVSSVSSMASHHFVWCTGACTPVTGDG